jgi:hypothetical protein
MEHVNTHTHRQPLSTLVKIMIGALLINVLAQVVGILAELVQGEGLNIPHLVIGVLILLAAGLVATGKRWALPLSVLIVLGTNVLLVIQPTNTATLLHPGASVGHFGTLVLCILSALVVIVVGILAFLQNPQRSAPSLVS